MKPNLHNRSFEVTVRKKKIKHRITITRKMLMLFLEDKCVDYDIHIDELMWWYLCRYTNTYQHFEIDEENSLTCLECTVFSDPAHWKDEERTLRVS